jgi:hypothetical protein
MNLFGWPDHVGKRGERVRLSLKFVKRFVATKGPNPGSSIYTFEDRDANQFVWFSDVERPLVQGQWYEVGATIKRHSSFKGVRRTVLERCVFNSKRKETPIYPTLKE